MFKWPHAPAHYVKEVGVYMVTAATLHKEHLFNSDQKLDLLSSSVLEILDEYGWGLQAWAVFPNHYHFVARSPSQTGDLTPVIKKLHANTARELNKMDVLAGRKVWHQFRETQITFEKSYFARLHYVHQNPVRHKVAQRAEDYKWCSASWFLTRADLPLIETVQSFPIDRLNIDDEY